MRTIGPQEGRKRSDESPVRLNGCGIRYVRSPIAKVSIRIHAEPCGINGCIDKINRAWKGGPENTLALARLLHRARQRLKHGQWSPLWRSERVPVSKRKAEMLVIIGQGLGGTNIATRQEILTKSRTGCNPRLFSKIMDTIAQTNFQSPCDSQKRINDGNLLTMLVLSHVNWIEVNPFGALLLGQPFQLPIFSNAAAQKFSVFFASGHLPGIKRFHEQPSPNCIRRVVVRRMLISPASTFWRFRVAISAFSANSSCVMPRRARSRRTFAPKTRILDHSFLSRGTTYYIADAGKQ